VTRGRPLRMVVHVLSCFSALPLSHSLPTVFHGPTQAAVIPALVLPWTRGEPPPWSDR
jgi:hypothetical protein